MRSSPETVKLCKYGFVDVNMGQEGRSCQAVELGRVAQHAIDAVAADLGVASSPLSPRGNKRGLKPATTYLEERDRS
jgi:hypothetical protein